MEILVEREREADGYYDIIWRLLAVLEVNTAFNCRIVPTLIESH